LVRHVGPEQPVDVVQLVLDGIERRAEGVGPGAAAIVAVLVAGDQLESLVARLVLDVHLPLRLALAAVADEVLEDPHHRFAARLALELRGGEKEHDTLVLVPCHAPDDDWLPAIAGLRMLEDLGAAQLESGLPRSLKLGPRYLARQKHGAPSP